MTLYESLGVRKVINAAAAQTVLGGSLMPESVLDAMRDAAGSYVYLPELHDRVGERVSVLTQNEAACICAGAAAGILVAAAAMLTGEDSEKALALPDVTGIDRTEIIIFRAHQNGFASGISEAGATMVEVENTESALIGAIGPRTAAVLWFAGDFWPEPSPSIERTIAIAHERGVPVIVDAADQLPPLEKLWFYTRELGAELAIFSGGKGLRGPQSAGLIVGKAEYIRACRLNSGPFHSIGRPAKVGKEEMAGLLAALEWSLAQDAIGTRAKYEAIVEGWLAGLAGIEEISLSKVAESHSGQPIPRVVLTFGDSRRRDAVVATLWECSPRIAVLPEGETAIALNPQGVGPGEERQVLEALVAAIG